MEYEEQVKKQLEYTTYGDKNQYKKSRWVDWFLGERQENKNAIAYDINNDPDLENALKSNLYYFWLKEGTATSEEKKISWEEFQNTTIKLYRGVSHKNIKEGTVHQNGFTSYALVKGLAEKFSATGEVKEYNIKVSDLYGSVNIVGGEIEVLEPQPYSDKFANQVFREIHDKLFQTDFIDDPKGWEKYKEIKKDKGSSCAYMYAKNYINKEKKTIAEIITNKSAIDIILTKAGFDPNQSRDSSGKWGSGEGEGKKPKEPKNFLGYHSSQYEINETSKGDILDSSTYSNLIRSAYIDFGGPYTKDIEEMADWFESEGYGFTFVSKDIIKGTAFQASKYKYGEYLYKVYGNGWPDDIEINDPNELDATIIMSKKPLRFVPQD